MSAYRCAVMGNPIAHSQSPQIHQAFAKACAIDLVYDKILVPVQAFAQAVNSFYQPHDERIPVGLNITLPFKEQAHDLAEGLTERARYAGAVNTLYQQNGQLFGDNTDGIGLCQAITHTHGHALAGQSVLLLGAGGAARGVIYPLLQAGIQSLCLANRTVSKAQALVESHQALAPTTPLTACTLEAIENKPFDVIINATSSGLEDTQLPLPTGIISPQTVCYDMVYGRKTVFLQWAEAQGTQYTYDGYSMLVAQARCSFERWFGRTAFKEASCL